ncbi:hypothetical protein VNI00_009456 [Paramarasmius palmivorus]|uniref:Uncharacterized protein n=1 Tax=Paramarasmius palmivorus TaxID=297713 RepID=A0AAW0CQD4_9AGAR
MIFNPIALLLTLSSVSTIVLAAPTVPSVAVRQTSDNDPFKNIQDVPQKCKSQCEATDTDYLKCTESGKASEDCLCQNDLLNRISTCFGCVASENKEPVDKYQGAMDVITGACNAAGIKVNSQKVSNGGITLNREGALRMTALGMGVGLLVLAA